MADEKSDKDQPTRRRSEPSPEPVGPSKEELDARYNGLGVDVAGVEHSEGGITTKHDATDVGVPMLPGDKREPQGPEDALGPGAKRGDYSERVGSNDYHPTQAVPVRDAKPGEPQTQIVDQRERANDQGNDEPAKKGGVTTASTGDVTPEGR